MPARDISRPRETPPGAPSFSRPREFDQVWCHMGTSRKSEGGCVLRASYALRRGLHWPGIAAAPPVPAAGTGTGTGAASENLTSVHVTLGARNSQCTMQWLATSVM